MEEMADWLTRRIYETFRKDAESSLQCSLVRVFKTCSYDELTGPLRQLVPDEHMEDSRYLALLASRGEHAGWNSRHTSRGHKVIALESREVVESIPMISNMIRMLGLDVNDVVRPNPDMSVAGFYPLNVFYVPSALGCPFIPAQEEFVVPYGIESIVGFGGLLTYTDVFVVIMFFKVPVPRRTAVMFKDLASVAHDLLAPFQQEGKIFKA